MNSGIRFSVALIVVVVVLLGLYYAGLEDPGPPTEDGEPVAVEVLPETPTAPDDAPAREPEPEPVPEITIVEEPEDLADDPAPEFDEFPAEIVEVATADDMSSDGADPAEATANDVDAATDGDQGEPATEPADLDPEADSTVAAGVPAESTTIEASPPSIAEGPGRSIDARGMGLHRLASISGEGDLATAAMRAISEADGPGEIPGPAGSVWLPLPEGTDDTLLVDAMIGRTPGDETPHVLVLTGGGNVLDLADRVGSTTVTGGGNSGLWQVQFRPTAASLDTLRTASRPFVGKPVAWIGNGRLIVIHAPVVPISGRGVVPAVFRTEAEADAVVAALEGRTVIADAAAEPEDGTTGSGNDGAAVVVGAGSLPPDQYTDYVVAAGDTFEGIAMAWFGDRAKASLIAEANPYAESSRLSVGQVLRLPPKDIAFETAVPAADPATGVRTYTVRSGDTLGRIAQQAYGKASEWPRIHEANRGIIGDDPGNLKVGMELVIP